MHFDVQDQGSCVKRLQVDVPAEELGVKFTETVREIKKVAQVPGFRPGRAPEQMLRKRYLSEIASQVFEELVKDAVTEVLKENEWDLAAQVKLENEKEATVPEEGKDYQFVLLLEVHPEVNLPEYKGVELKTFPSDPTDEEIDGAISELREQSARFHDIEGRAVQDGDMVVVSYQATAADGTSLEELTGGVGRLAQANDLWVPVDEQAPELIPGLKTALKGLAIGEQTKVDVTFPEEFPVESMRGVAAVYDVTVVGIKEKRLPELNDEWAETLRMSSVQGLRDAVASDLMIRKENARESHLYEQAVKYLVDNSVFEIPPAVLADETRIAVYDLIDRTRKRGADDEFIREKQDELVQAATQRAIQQARRQYVLSEVASREGIELATDEVDDFVRELAAQEKTPFRKFYQKMVQDGRLDRVKEFLLTQKALEFVVSNANVIEDAAAE